MNNKNNRGFTLTEILIVVAILGILVTIAVPALSTSKQDAQRAKRVALTKAIESAKQSYLNSDAGVASYGTVAKFSDFGKYLTLNGAKITNDASITNSKLNGTGQNIVNYGSYPSVDSLTNNSNTNSTGLGSGKPVSWSTDGTKL